MNDRIKKRLLSLIVNLGLLKLFKIAHRRKHIILTFHRVVSYERIDDFDTCPSVTVKNFELIVTHVMHRYQIVPLQYLCDNLNTSDRLAAITFDDGWRDNYTNAYPVLKKYKIPATIFVTTGKIGSNEPFWQQCLGDIFRDAKKGNESATTKLFDIIGLEESCDICRDLYWATVDKWKSFSLEIIEEKLSGYFSSDFTEDERFFLNAKEIQLMNLEGGIDFGSHTENHVILPNESFDRIKTELSDSKAKLEDITGKKHTMFSYPNGNFTKKIVRQAKLTGYSIGCTTQVSCVGDKVDKMMIPRIDTEWDKLTTKDGSVDDNLFQWLTR